MGATDAFINCPHCGTNGSQFEWNVATADDFGVDSDTVFTRIQQPELESFFTCAYCYEISTTEELGLLSSSPSAA